MDFGVGIDGEFVTLRVGADLFGLSPDMANKIAIALMNASQKIRKDYSSGK